MIKKSNFRNAGVAVGKSSAEGGSSFGVGGGVVVLQTKY